MLVRESFDQARRLEEEVSRLGGPEAASRDPEKRKQLAECLAAADQVVVATIAAEVEDSRKTLDLAVAARFAAAREEQEARSAAMARQLDTLTTMVSAIAKMRGGGEEGCVDHLTPEIAREVQVKMPIPAREPARLAALKKTGLTGDDVRRWVGDADLNAIVAEARDAHDADAAFIGSVEEERQTYLTAVLKHDKGDRGAGLGGNQNRVASTPRLRR